MRLCNKVQELKRLRYCGRIKILEEVSEAEREGSDVLGEESKGFGEWSGGIGGSGD